MTEPDDEMRTWVRQLFSDTPQPEEPMPPARPLTAADLGDERTPTGIFSDQK